MCHHQMLVMRRRRRRNEAAATLAQTETKNHHQNNNDFAVPLSPVVVTPPPPLSIICPPPHRLPQVHQQFFLFAPFPTTILIIIMILFVVPLAPVNAFSNGVASVVDTNAAAAAAINNNNMLVVDSSEFSADIISQAFVQTGSELHYFRDISSSSHHHNHPPQHQPTAGDGGGAGAAPSSPPARPPLVGGAAAPSSAGAKGVAANKKLRLLEDDGFDKRAMQKLALFESESTDFGKSAFGVPVQRRVFLSNPTDATIIISAITSSSISFHCSFVEQTSLASKERTSFRVYFLPVIDRFGPEREVIKVHTSVGTFSHRVQAELVGNPYRIRSFLDIRLPLNATFSAPLSVHNPHTTPMVMSELFVSDCNVHVELNDGTTVAMMHQQQQPAKQMDNNGNNRDSAWDGQHEQHHQQQQGDDKQQHNQQQEEGDSSSDSCDSSSNNNNNNCEMGNGKRTAAMEWRFRPFETKQIGHAKVLGNIERNSTAFIVAKMRKMVDARDNKGARRQQQQQQQQDARDNKDARQQQQPPPQRQQETRMSGLASATTDVDDGTFGGTNVGGNQKERDEMSTKTTAPPPTTTTTARHEEEREGEKKESGGEEADDEEQQPSLAHLLVVAIGVQVTRRRALFPTVDLLDFGLVHAGGSVSPRTFSVYSSLERGVEIESLYVEKQSRGVYLQFESRPPISIKSAARGQPGAPVTVASVNIDPNILLNASPYHNSDNKRSNSGDDSAENNDDDDSDEQQQHDNDQQQRVVVVGETGGEREGGADKANGGGGAGTDQDGDGGATDDGTVSGGKVVSSGMESQTQQRRGDGGAIIGDANNENVDGGGRGGGASVRDVQRRMLATRHGMVVAETRGGNYKVSIPFRAVIYKGELEHDTETTAFHHALEPPIHREVFVTNALPFGLAVWGVQLASNATDAFQASIIAHPAVILSPGQSLPVLLLTYTQKRPIGYTSNVILHTNVTTFVLPIVVFGGDLWVRATNIRMYAHKQNEFDFGSIGWDERRTILFSLFNPNPVTLRLGRLGVPPFPADALLSLSFLGVRRMLAEHQQQDNNTWGKSGGGGVHLVDQFSSSSPSNDDANKASAVLANGWREGLDFALPAHTVALFNMTLSARSQHRNSVPTRGDNIFRIHTQFGAYEFPVKFDLVDARLESVPSKIVFHDSFVGTVQTHPIKFFNTFAQNLHIHRLSIIDDDPRFKLFHHQPTNSSATKQQQQRLIPPKSLVTVANVAFVPGAQCPENCYLGIPLDTSDGQWFAYGMKLPQNLAEIDHYLYARLRQKWLAMSSDGSDGGEHKQAATVRTQLRVDTDRVKNLEVPIEGHLVWPRLLSHSVVHFPLTAVGNFTIVNLTLSNPTMNAVIVQLLPLVIYPDAEFLLDLFRAELPVPLADPVEMNETLMFSLRDTELFTLRPGSPVPQLREEVEAILGGPVPRFTQTLLLRPGMSTRIRIGFLPNDYTLHSSLLLIRNNLTALEPVVLYGRGAKMHMDIDNKTARSLPLLFEIQPQHLTDCANPRRQLHKLPTTLTVRRSFVVRNSGEVSFSVFNISVSNVPCENRGFRVLNCDRFRLEPNETTLLDIAYTPDFLLSTNEATLQLYMHMNGTPWAFNLVATIPPHLLSVCHAALPRPPFESVMYYTCVLALTFCFICVVSCAYLEGDRVITCAYRQQYVTQQCQDDKVPTAGGLDAIPAAAAFAASSMPNEPNGGVVSSLFSLLPRAANAASTTEALMDDDGGGKLLPPSRRTQFLQAAQDAGPLNKLFWRTLNCTLCLFSYVWPLVRGGNKQPPMVGRRKTPRKAGGGGGEATTTAATTATTPMARKVLLSPPPQQQKQQQQHTMTTPVAAAIIPTDSIVGDKSKQLQQQQQQVQHRRHSRPQLQQQQQQLQHGHRQRWDEDEEEEATKTGGRTVITSRRNNTTITPTATMKCVEDDSASEEEDDDEDEEQVEDDDEDVGSETTTAAAVETTVEDDDNDDAVLQHPKDPEHLSNNNTISNNKAADVARHGTTRTNDLHLADPYLYMKFRSFLNAEKNNADGLRHRRAVDGQQPDAQQQQSRQQHSVSSSSSSSTATTTTSTDNNSKQQQQQHSMNGTARVSSRKKQEEKKQSSTTKNQTVMDADCEKKQGREEEEEKALTHSSSNMNGNIDNNVGRSVGEQQQRPLRHENSRHHPLLSSTVASRAAGGSGSAASRILSSAALPITTPATAASTKLAVPRMGTNVQEDGTTFPPLFNGLVPAALSTGSLNNLRGGVRPEWFDRLFASTTTGGTTTAPETTAATTTTDIGTIGQKRGGEGVGAVQPGKTTLNSSSINNSSCCQQINKQQQQQPQRRRQQQAATTAAAAFREEEFGTAFVWEQLYSTKFHCEEQMEKEEDQGEDEDEDEEEEEKPAVGANNDDDGQQQFDDNDEEDDDDTGGVEGNSSGGGSSAAPEWADQAIADFATDSVDADFFALADQSAQFFDRVSNGGCDDFGGHHGVTTTGAAAKAVLTISNSFDRHQEWESKEASIQHIIDTLTEEYREQLTKVLRRRTNSNHHPLLNIRQLLDDLNLSPSAFTASALPSTTAFSLPGFGLPNESSSSSASSFSRSTDSSSSNCNGGTTTAVKSSKTTNRGVASLPSASATAATTGHHHRRRKSPGREFSARVRNYNNGRTTTTASTSTAPVPSAAASMPSQFNSLFNIEDPIWKPIGPLDEQHCWPAQFMDCCHNGTSTSRIETGTMGRLKKNKKTTNK